VDDRGTPDVSDPERASDVLEAYLDRLRLARPAAADLETLTAIMGAHLRAIPFENLDIHLGRTIVLTEAAIVDKLVRARRGGFCYELNGGFGWLLRRLGYDVTLLQARVYGADRLGPPYDHLALRVDLERPMLVDVGFGTFVEGPVPLAPGEHADPAGLVELVPREHGDLEVRLDGTRQYLLDLRSRELEEFAPACWWHQTWPDSHFRQGPVCSLLTDEGRVTLAGRTLVRHLDGERTEIELAGRDAVLTAYRELFGVELDEEPVAVERP
jgi:N-hydroxyarylamine O-acetyltransferase